jgi:cell division septation protein DedD
MAVPTAPEPPASAKVSPPSGKGAWWVQLASLPGGKGRDAEMARLKRKHRELGSLSLRIVNVRLDRGAYERIQAGPFAGREGAKQLCASLAKLKQPCIVVGP